MVILAKRQLLSGVILGMAIFLPQLEAMQAVQLLSTAPARPGGTTEMIVRLVGKAHAHVSLKETLIFFLCFGAFVVGILLLAVYAQKRRSDRIEAAAVRLGFPFRRKPSEGDKALVADFFLANIRKAPCNVVEVSCNENSKITLFDFVYTDGDKKDGKARVQTITRLESPALHLPRFMLCWKEAAWRLPKLSGMSDLRLPVAPEFNREYNLRAAEEAKVQRLFTPAVLHYFRQQNYLTIAADDRVMFLFRFDKMMEATELTAFVEEGKQVLALFLEASRNSDRAAS